MPEHSGGKSSYRTNPGVLHQYVLGLTGLSRGGKFAEVQTGWIDEYDHCTTTAYQAWSKIDRDPAQALGEWQVARPVYQKLLREYAALEGHHPPTLADAHKAFDVVDARFISGKFREEMARQPGGEIDQPENPVAIKVQALALIEAAKKAHEEIVETQNELATKILSAVSKVNPMEPTELERLNRAAQESGNSRRRAEGAIKILELAETAVKIGKFHEAVAALNKQHGVGQAAAAGNLVGQVVSAVSTGLSTVLTVTGNAFKLFGHAEVAESFADAAEILGKTLGGMTTALSAIYHTYTLIQGIRHGDAKAIATSTAGLGQVGGAVVGLTEGGAAVGAGLTVWVDLALQTFLAFGNLGGTLRGLKRNERMKEVDVLVRESVPVLRHFDRAKRAYYATTQTSGWGVGAGIEARAEKMGSGTTRIEGLNTLAGLATIANLASSPTIRELDKQEGGKLARGLNLVPRQFEPHDIFSLELAVKLVAEGIQEIADWSALKEGAISKLEDWNISQDRRKRKLSKP